MDNLNDYCAEGTTYAEEMVQTSEYVSLRVITFSGPDSKNNPDVVFVAGWVSLMEGWQEVLREMTKYYKVIYIETREKISSKISGKAQYNVKSIGDDIVFLIDQFKYQTGEYILFGSSLGATTILDCYVRLKKKPLCLISIGPNAEFRVPRTWIILVTLFYPPLYNILKPSVKWYLRTFRMDLKSDYAQYEKYSRALDAGDPWKLKKAVLSLASYEIWDFLTNIDCPTLVIGASKDKLHEPENLKRIVDILPDAKYIDLETNKQTHSKKIIDFMREYLKQLP